MSTTSTTSNDIVYVQSRQNTITATGDIAAGDAGIDQNVATDALVLTFAKN